jgi:hypothetical protein
MGDPWYDNKQLFEMVQELKEDIRTISSEMKQTTEIIKKYNGLREQMEH